MPFESYQVVVVVEMIFEIFRHKSFLAILTCPNRSEIVKNRFLIGVGNFIFLNFKHIVGA